jgi:hypothetical protein
MGLHGLLQDELYLLSSELLTEMRTRNFLGGGEIKGRPARKSDNLTALYEPTVQKNVKPSTSHTPMGLHGLLQGQLYFYRLGDRLCGQVVRVPGYRSRGTEFNSQRYQIFREVVGLERGPPSLVSVRSYLNGKAANPGLENRD